MSGALSFRPMLASDLRWVAAIESRVQAFPWSEHSFADSLATGHGAWVAQLGTELAGFAIVMQVLDEAHLLNIGVSPGFQRQGIGRALLRAIKPLLQQNGAESLLLEVRVSNHSAKQFYLAEGFDVIGQRRAYYPAVNGREDAVVMRRALNEELAA